MAIKSTAGEIGLYLYSRPDATPPIIFPDFLETSHFTVSIMAKVLNNAVPGTLLAVEGTNGSRIIISIQVGYWLFEIRDGSTVFVQLPLAITQLNVWTAFCIVKNGPSISLWHGTEIEAAPGDPPNAIQLSPRLDMSPGFEFFFDHAVAVTNPDMAICNLRYWNISHNLGEVSIFANEWDLSGGAKQPIWSSTLRTPGDISNIVGIYTSPIWNRGHEFSIISPAGALAEFYLPDPAYLTTRNCPTWVYPPDYRTVLISVNPGVTPSVPTTYKSTDFIQFVDRGSVPPVVLLAQFYCAYPSSVGAGQSHEDSMPAYIDENNVDFPFDVNDPSFWFGTLTRTNIPAAMTGINMYGWKFGGQFIWAAGAAIPTATATLTYTFLYVIYNGIPTGKPSLPIDDLAGLFAIQKGQLVDKYNRGVEVKIPDPTIRTAYIGE